MAGNWSYDRLSAPHVSRHDQDITELSVNDEFRDTLGLLHVQDSQIPLRRLSSSQYALSDPPPPFSQYDPIHQHSGPDDSSRKSFDSFQSTATGSSTKKLKDLFRRRPLPKYLRGSIRRHAAADVEPARVGRGIWKDQLLSDRSFRTMAATMSVLALGMIVLIACNIKHVVNRTNLGSTSVGGTPDSCKKVTYTNTACLLIINVCATMVLGMSNTYQQIVTSLKISDLKYALSKFGDSRVGTNSPLNIRHKEKGRKRAWAAWFLLIFTSMPVHFLANSLIGPSYTQELPEVIEFNPLDRLEISTNFIATLGAKNYLSGDTSFPCWSAFRKSVPESYAYIDEIGHCQKCKKWNTEDKFANLPQPTIATKIKKSLISNLGNTALTQMLIMMFCSLALLTGSLTAAVILGSDASTRNKFCRQLRPNAPKYEECDMSSTEYFETISGGFGGFNRSLTLTSLPPDNMSHEFIAFAISNAAQFIYSLLYLMMIYNITLISQESDWGKLEYRRKRIRTTLVSGTSFNETYLLQLPKKILFPIMAYSTLTHWMLGEALQAHEAIWIEYNDGRHVEHSKYILKWAAYPLWFATVLILLMTAVCWWAFTYKREGFIPQMFGSVRVIMASTTALEGFPDNGIQWGDLGEGQRFRHAGLSAEEVGKIVPNELYAGVGGGEKDVGGK
ncbi:hypothetical protein ACET3X_001601 [Alternaria dauci]|uniref:DUF6536 domain-containing protein n=1 Tax=Alternaria dauci TaxID=48095 RepID=A0ABR3UZW3_9PLEO